MHIIPKYSLSKKACFISGDISVSGAPDTRRIFSEFDRSRLNNQQMAILNSLIKLSSMTWLERLTLKKIVLSYLVLG